MGFQSGSGVEEGFESERQGYDGQWTLGLGPDWIGSGSPVWKAVRGEKGIEWLVEAQDA